MVRTTDATQRARQMLRECGFGFVQQESTLPGARSTRIDLVAWASNESGELVPWAAIEVEPQKSAKPDLSLPKLARSRDLLGTRDHYVVVSGDWFKADRGIRSLERVDGPERPLHSGGGFLKNEELATNLLSAKLWKESDRQRVSEGPVSGALPGEILYDTSIPGIMVSEEDFIPVDFDVLRRARRRAIVGYFIGGRSTGTYASTPVVAEAVALLVGDRMGEAVLDPFCGTGSFLWAVMDRAVQSNKPAQFLGYELNPAIAEAAAAIGRSERMPTAIEAQNAFEVEWPEVQVVVTAPPLGTRLEKPHLLLDGSATTDGVAAAVDQALRSLEQGGRAVFHLGLGFTFHAKLETYRQYLARELRVAALIGLPAGAVPGTAIRSILLVVDRAESGETFIAQLGEDWKAQLSRGGAAIEAAVKHLEGDGLQTKVTR